MDLKREQEFSKELLLGLPQEKNWAGTDLYLYQGVWCEPKYFQGLISFRKHFQAQDTDVVLVTIPKSGTTWLKGLAFAIINRTPKFETNSPLLAANPHDLVPFLEFDLYHNNPTPLLDNLSCPRLLAVHAPYKMLPSSMTSNDSKCRFVYLCRNPLDQFVSYFKFFHEVSVFQENGNKARAELDDAFDAFCRGVQIMGPFWDHILGYWKASLERPDNVLFLKYEDLKADTAFYVKKMAEFLGCPFSEEEESQEVVEKIVKLCSFSTMKDLEVNKIGENPHGFENKYFFRNGKVGDSANYLTPEMVERAEKLINQKFDGSGLTFDFIKKAPKI